MLKKTRTLTKNKKMAVSGRCSLPLFLLILVTGCSGAKHTQTLAERQCGHRDGTADDRITACTQVISTTQPSQEAKTFHIIPDAFSNRAEAYKEKRQYDLSIADYNQAIQIDPETVNLANGSYFRGRGEVYILRKQYDLAIRDFDRDIQGVSAVFSSPVIYDPNKIMLGSALAPAYLDRGLAFRAQGRLDLARRDFSTAKQMDPKIHIPE